MSNLPTKPEDDVRLALREADVTAQSLVQMLAQIATSGRKVTTVIKNGQEVQKTITDDPALRLQAVDRLIKLAGLEEPKELRLRVGKDW